jgi:hypothetical protein
MATDEVNTGGSAQFPAPQGPSAVAPQQPEQFVIGPARFLYSPAAASSQQQALATCREWSASSRLMWWDNLAELDAVTAKFKAPDSSFLFTDLQCSLAQSAMCRWGGSGAPAEAQDLRWYKQWAPPGAAALPALLFLRSGGAPAWWGLALQQEGMAAGVLCREGGE